MEKRIVASRRPRGAAGEDTEPMDEAQRPAISLEEWLAHVEASASLVAVRLAANESDALRAARPARVRDRSTDLWLYWSSGEIHADGFDTGVLAAMLQVARALDAEVRRDDEAQLRVSARTSREKVPPDRTQTGPVPRDEGSYRTGCRLVHRREDTDSLADRRARQALLLAGTVTVVCVASAAWLVQA